MKTLIYTLALISAFFVSSTELDLDNLLSPKSEEVRNTCLGPYGSPDDSVSSCEANFQSAIDQRKSTSRYVSDSGVTSKKIRDDVVRFTFKYVHCGRAFDPAIGCDMPQNYNIYNDYGVIDTKTCPPDGSPLHIYSHYLVPNDEDSLMCAKEKEITPPDNCDEFGDNSWLPQNDKNHSTGVEVCYTNPATGKSCKYTKNNIAGYKASGGECTGEEPDYGEKPEPQEPPTDPDTPPNDCKSYGNHAQTLMCPVNPNEKCNTLQVGGGIQYQCPAGCGSIEGKYYCSHEDSDGNGVPDDWPEGLPPTTEPPTEPPPPTTEPPTTEGTNNLLNGIQGELSRANQTLNGIKQNTGKTNNILDGINTGIQGLKKSQGEGNKALGGIEKNTQNTAKNTAALVKIAEDLGKTDVKDSFNPDLATGFYESAYENGFTGIWEEKSVLFSQTETIQFLQQFKFNAGGSPPDTRICFNLGGTMDFGCAELPTPSPQLLAILKIFILITAAFLCRALIFGG